MNEELNNKKILIAEDEDSYAKALSMKLSNAGFEVTVVGNGEEAIEAVKKESFSLLFLDLIMPKVNGFEVLQFIKEKGIDLTVVVFSSLSQDEDRQKVFDLGAVDFINKANISISDVLKIAKRYLEVK